MRADKLAGMSPAQRYQAELAREDFSPDAAQAAAVECLESIWTRLVETRERGILRSLASLLGSRLLGMPPTYVRVEGLYMWGGVGRGKTFLMDLFFHSLPFPEKRRQHFHRFMQDIHRRLKQLKHLEDPLDKVAKDIALEARVICFDEFFVADIADAMILGRLFQKLFALNVTLIATSNIPPDNLYRNGLQRERFKPAIAAIKKNCRTLNVDGGIDYRLRVLEMAEIYHYPLDEEAERNLEYSFSHLCPDNEDHEVGGNIEIEGRKIPVRKCAEGVAWFDFEAICDGPRSAADYIEIAQLFHTVLVSGIPVLDWTKENQARRFISMIDELYDHNVNLMISAEVSLEELYQGKRLASEFDRTISRLQEMQSLHFLELPHIQ